LSQVVTTAALEPDPLDPTKKALFVGGTAGDDHIEIEREGCRARIEVEVESEERCREDFRFEAGRRIRFERRGRALSVRPRA